MGVCLLATGCAACLCVCVCACMCVCDIKSEYQKRKHIKWHTSVNLTRCCIKHISRSSCSSGTKVARLDKCRSLISLKNMAPLTIQPNKQDIRKSTGVGGCRQQGTGATKFEKKRGVSNIEGFFIKQRGQNSSVNYDG